MQIIRKNFGLKILALTLAIVGWAYFRFAGNPIFATARFDQQLFVPIEAEHVPPGLVASYDQHQAMVTIALHRDQPSVTPSRVRAVLDLSDKAAGVYNVPVQLVAPDVAVQTLSPGSVSVTLTQGQP